MKRKTRSQAFSHAVRDQKSTEQTFMDKGAVSQGTKDEKNKKKKVKAAGRELSNQQQKILAIWEK